MKDIVKCAEKADEKQEKIETTTPTKRKSDEEKKESTDLKQPSIFDFQ